jgi:hypothetical protein
VIKETVELYLLSTSVPLWPVIRRNLPVLLPSVYLKEKIPLCCKLKGKKELITSQSFVFN